MNHSFTVFAIAFLFCPVSWLNTFITLSFGQKINALALR